VRRRMGPAVLEQLVAPVVRGVHSTSPDELPLDRAAPGLASALAREGSLSHAVASLRERSPAGSQVAGIRGGVGLVVPV
ncbi:MAG: protoporphyrinogen oxidase, partial [Leifsonia sp.]